jgi:SAM-dependent methyltransferase
MKILDGSAKQQLKLNQIANWQNKNLLGHKTFLQECNLLNNFSSQLAGKIVLQVLFNESYNLGNLSNFDKNYKLIIKENCNNYKAAAIVNSESLPVIPNVIDLIVMPHILEIYQNPEDIIKETSNALTTSGKLLLSGFNPISCINLVKLVSSSLREAFTDVSFIRVSTLCQLLAKYDIEVESIKYSGFFCHDMFYNTYLGSKLESLLTAKKVSAGFCYTVLASKKNYCPLIRSSDLRNLQHDLYPNSVTNPSLGQTFKK